MSKPGIREPSPGERTAGASSKRSSKSGGRRAGSRRPPRRRGFTAEQISTRAGLVPTLSYPEELPVSAAKDEISAAIRDHQVVIVAGETGSGKTTQIPKICLELGRGVAGQIGHTQPRRIAARSVAERIAEELDVPLGEQIGYQVRFTDHANDHTLVKVMTDGILLAEIQRDRMLSKYDTIIVDEAHERSLNIDFILGYLKQLLPKRPDLKVIITSATIDPERFANHFTTGPNHEPAPIIEVSGRTYPVEVRYRPLLDEQREVDPLEAIESGVRELMTEGDGDILVFLSGEREIRDTADLLNGLNLKRTEIVPLYARLSAAEQHRVFSSHPGRRIVLATNVAETSLTVPGIRYVIDAGTARISRYSARTKVQRLPIEPISQASANQRSGRCGRVADGICLRLYSEEDYFTRPEFTDPEILRTNLASVILQMAALGLGEVERFPFVEPPDIRNIRDGVSLLGELGALNADAGRRRELTTVGRTLVRLPVDPRMARMIVEAQRLNCVREVIIIAAAMTIQDPRERPLELQQAATEKHSRFVDPTSDFLAYLKLWNYLKEQRKALSGSQFRRMCRAEFLNYMRVREWQDLVAQLKRAAKDVGIQGSSAQADPDDVQKAILSGLLSQIGLRESTRNEFLGARGAKFAVFPGSGLFKKPPAWVMAGELVETSRLWARVVGRIDPEWAEELAPHLVKRNYSEPHWSASRGAVMASEKILLYGLPLVASRPINYDQIDPALCREMFIRHALVDGEWTTHHVFYRKNLERLNAAEELENRARKRGLVVDDETLFEFYNSRIPAEIVTVRHFDGWWKKAKRETPRLLDFDPEMLVTDAAEAISADAFPTSWRVADLVLPVSYSFDPGGVADGLTLHLPLEVLNQIDSKHGFDRLVPGMREELVTALIKALPKTIRKHFVPAPNFAALALPAVNERLESPDGQGVSIVAALAEELTRIGGFSVDAEDFELFRLPEHLRPTFQVVDGTKVLSSGRDLAELKVKLAPKVSTAVAAQGSDLEQRGLTKWPSGVGLCDGAIPTSYEQVRAGHVVRGYPALVDQGNHVDLLVLTTAAEQSRAHAHGVRRLLALQVPSPMRAVHASLTGSVKLILATSAYRDAGTLLADLIDALLDEIVGSGDAVARDSKAFVALIDAATDYTEATPASVSARAKPGPPLALVPPRPVLEVRAEQALVTIARILDEVRTIERRVTSMSSMTLLPNLADVKGQLADLFRENFISAAGVARLCDLERYARAISRRLDKMPEHGNRDRQLQWQVEQISEEFEKVRDQLSSAGRSRVRWMIEEYRVSLFAQELGTSYPVSEKRIRKVLTEER